MTPAGLRSLFRRRRLNSAIAGANPHRFRHTFGADSIRSFHSLLSAQGILIEHTNRDQIIDWLNHLKENPRQAVHESHAQSLQRSRDRRKNDHS